MRLPRFRIRTLMIAVAMVAALLAGEPLLFHVAAEYVRSGDPTYIWGEAVTVWATINVGLLVVGGFVVATIRATMGELKDE